MLTRRIRPARSIRAPGGYQILRVSHFLRVSTPAPPATTHPGTTGNPRTTGAGSPRPPARPRTRRLALAGWHSLTPKEPHPCSIDVVARGPKAEVRKPAPIAT